MNTARILQKNDTDVNHNTGGFTCMPNGWMEAAFRKGLSHLQVRCLLFISSKTHGEHQGSVDLSLAQIADVVGSGKGHVSAALRVLEEKGFIERGFGKIVVKDISEKKKCGSLLLFPSEKEISEKHAMPSQGGEKKPFTGARIGNSTPIKVPTGVSKSGTLEGQKPPKGSRIGNLFPLKQCSAVPDFDPPSFNNYIKTAAPPSPPQPEKPKINCAAAAENFRKKTMDDLDDVLNGNHSDEVKRLLSLRSEETAKALEAAFREVEFSGNTILHAERKYRLLMRICRISDAQVQKNCADFVDKGLAYKDGLRNVMDYLGGVICRAPKAEEGGKSRDYHKVVEIRHEILSGEEEPF